MGAAGGVQGEELREIKPESPQRTSTLGLPWRSSG